MSARAHINSRRWHLLLASSSLAALMISGGTPSAFAAACNHTIVAAFDNPAAHTTANVCVRNTSFTGNITNEGTISPSGIAFVNGTITGAIGSTGVINGGISLDSTSRINATASAIGISGSTFTGGIVNNGAITTNGFGLSLQVSTFSGGISLGSSGSIIAGQTAIKIGSPGAFTGGITNAGTITSVTNDGIRLEGTLGSFGGGISNSGVITAKGTGLNILDSTYAGGVVNSGSVAANLDAITVFVSTFLGGISNSGLISSHSVTGILVISTSTFAGGITNSGTISGAVNGISLATVQAFTEGISNGGLISATTGAGIALDTVSTFAGGITNTGTISAGGDGIITFNHTVAVFSGGITNTGTVTAHGIGIHVDATTFAGGITNGGSISANTGIVVTAVSTLSGGISNAAGGRITSALTGIAVSNVSNFSGGVTNAGSIASASQLGIKIADVSTFAGGFTNSGTITAHNTGAFVTNIATLSGGMINSGTIVSAAQSGMYAFAVSAFSGGMTNSGTISAHAWGMYAQTISTFSGGMANSGTIAAGTNGIAAVGIQTFVGGINNSGSISAAVGIHLTTGSTFAGGISNAGAGNITSTLTGILATNVSNFSGGITNAGSISSAIQAGIVISNVSTFAGGFTNNGTITAHNSGAFATHVSTFAGGMSNTGTISSAAGSGMYAFTVSAFSGGMINSGTISAANWGMYAQTMSTFSGGMTNTGSITAGTNGVVAFGISTYAGGISNAGAISAGGYGVLVNNVGQLGGGVTNSGTIAGLTGIRVASSGPVSVFDSGTIIGTGGTAVDLSANGAGNTFTVAPSFNIVGNVLGSGSDIFQLGGTGSGAFNLSTIGPAQQYRGFTTFNVVGGIWNTAGTFGQAQAWNVLGGTLAGTGSFQSVNVAGGGTLEPGTPAVPGTFMTINGNLTFQPGSTYLVQINPTTASRANVGGTASLGGSVQGFLAPGSYSAKMTYDILHAASVVGTFTGFTPMNAQGFNATLTYTPTDVLLTLTMNLGLVGMNGNQQNVANAINTFFNNGGTLPAGFFPLVGLSGASLGAALTQIDGEAATGAERSAFQSMGGFLNLMLDPFTDGRNEPGAGSLASGFASEQAASFPPSVALAYNSVLKAPPRAPASFAQRWNAWGAAYGGSSTANGDPIAGSTNLTARTFGYAAGLDYHVSPDALLGIALAGGGTNWDLAQALGGGRSDAFQAGIYGKMFFGPAYVAAGFGFANHWFTTNRTAFAGDQLTAKFNGQSYGGRLEAGYRYGVLPNFGITPYAAVQAQSFRTASYSETDVTGGGFGLSYNAMTASDTRSELGARLDALQVVGGMPLIVRGRIAWAHDWVSTPSLSAAFEALPGANFIVNGAPIPKNSALASAGAELKMNTSWSVGAKFDGEFASGAQTYAGTGILRYAW